MNGDRLLKIGVIIIICTAVVVFSLILAPMIGNIFQDNEAQSNVGYSSETVRARVIKIHNEEKININGNEQTYQQVEIEVLEGEFKGSMIFIDFGKNQVMPEDYVLKVGDEILVNVGINLMDETTDGHFVDFLRGKSIILIFAIFTIIAFVIGSWTGLRSLLGMIVGLTIILLFIIPQIASGANPVLTSIIGSIFFLGISLYLVYGWQPMTHSAVISMAIALSLTGFLSFFFIRLARLTGFGNEDVMFLMQQSEFPIDMRGILLAGIIIGSLGVLDDLVVGQSSTVFQLYSANPSMEFSELFHSAMKVGRDHVSASVNTLVLAYAGESLPMLLLFSITNVDLSMAINVSYIAEEIVRALAGTIGLFISIPIATGLACFWVKRKKDSVDSGS